MRTPQDKTHTSELREKYKEMLKNDFSYGWISAELGISKGCLWRFVNRGYLPKDIKKRSALGVKLVSVDLPPCPNCGSVHTRKCSPKKERREPMLTGNPEDITVIKWWIEFFKSVGAC